MEKNREKADTECLHRLTKEIRPIFAQVAIEVFQSLTKCTNASFTEITCVFLLHATMGFSTISNQI